MDRLPTELWSRIFSLACTDDGHAGRSLAATSHYVRDVSREFKMQSIAWRSNVDLLAFHHTFVQGSSRKGPVIVKSLLVFVDPRDTSGWKGSPDDNKESSTLRSQVQRRFMSFTMSERASYLHQQLFEALQYLSLGLITLSISLNNTTLPLKLPQSCPTLRSLALIGPPLPLISGQTLNSGSYPALTHLHLMRCTPEILAMLISATTSLQYVRLSASEDMSISFWVETMSPFKDSILTQLDENPSLHRIVFEYNANPNRHRFPLFYQRERDLVSFAKKRADVIFYQNSEESPEVDLTQEWLECNEKGYPSWTDWKAKPPARIAQMLNEAPLAGLSRLATSPRHQQL